MKNLHLDSRRRPILVMGVLLIALLVVAACSSVSLPTLNVPSTAAPETAAPAVGLRILPIDTGSGGRSRLDRIANQPTGRG